MHGGNAGLVIEDTNTGQEKQTERVTNWNNDIQIPSTWYETEIDFVFATCILRTRQD